MNYHIGNEITNVLKLEGRTQKWLAKKVSCDPGNFNRILKRKSIDLDLLIRISIVLKHNFLTRIETMVGEEINRVH